MTSVARLYLEYNAKVSDCLAAFKKVDVKQQNEHRSHWPYSASTSLSKVVQDLLVSMRNLGTFDEDDMFANISLLRRLCFDGMDGRKKEMKAWMHFDVALEQAHVVYMSNKK